MGVPGSNEIENYFGDRRKKNNNKHCFCSETSAQKSAQSNAVGAIQDTIVREGKTQQSRKIRMNSLSSESKTSKDCGGSHVYHYIII